MKEEHGSEVFLRPRFSIDLEEKEDETLAKFKSNLKDGDCKYCSKIIDNHIFIDVPVDENHYWSPQLHLEIVNVNEQTKVKGLFGPKPQVRTMFMFLHLIVGTLFLIFSIMWYVRWTLDGNTFFPMLMTIILPIVWFGLYFFGRWGRRQGKEQIQELYSFLMKTLEKNHIK